MVTIVSAILHITDIFKRSSKDYLVSGWYDEMPGETQSSHAANMAALAEFTYDLDNNVQTFDITTPDVGTMNMIWLNFTLNNGISLLSSEHLPPPGARPRASLSRNSWFSSIFG